MRREANHFVAGANNMNITLLEGVWEERALKANENKDIRQLVLASSCVMFHGRNADGQQQLGREE